MEPHPTDPVPETIRPRLIINLGATLSLRFIRPDVANTCASASLENGLEPALRTALAALPNDPRRFDPQVECAHSITSVRITRGLASVEVLNNRIGARQLGACIARARQAIRSAPVDMGMTHWEELADLRVAGLAAPVCACAHGGVEGKRLQVEVLAAHLPPEQQANLDAALLACALPLPNKQTLAIIAEGETHTTKTEREAGIALLHVARSGAELAVYQGGHIVALSHFPAPQIDPGGFVLEAEIWLKRNSWDKLRLPHGIRVFDLNSM